MSDIAKQLGERIRQLRNTKHMSQEELAFKAGISPAHLGHCLDLFVRKIKRHIADPVKELQCGG